MDELKSFVISKYAAKLTPDDLVIEKLFGQASARQYFRAKLVNPNTAFLPVASDTGSFVIMKMPQGFASLAEEVTKVELGAPQEFPFLNVQRYLKGLDLPVPEVLAIDAEKGLVLLEDLGDRSLENLVKEADGDFFVFYYKKVIDLLIEMQERTLANPARDCIAYYRKFTEELLNWEFMHFLEYGIEDRHKIKVSDALKHAFQENTAKISKKISEMPQGFTHRDFQSRNVMFKNYNFHLIDFQDALVGPVLYDLVGLLRDSYIVFTEDHLHMLLEYYYDRLPKTHPYHGRLVDLKNDFHTVALQRKLKDTGRFQYIATVKNNPGFLPHVPLSLVYVRLAFAALPEYDELRSLIAEHIVELR